MKKILSNSLLLLFCLTMLTGCFFGSCADWNCSKPTKRWEKAVDDCKNKNFEIVEETLKYKSRIEVQDSEIGQHISTRCIINDGRYDVRKDKQYGHLFTK